MRTVRVWWWHPEPLTCWELELAKLIPGVCASHVLPKTESLPVVHARISDKDRERNRQQTAQTLAATWRGQGQPAVLVLVG